MNSLVINHIGDDDQPKFQVARQDYKSSKPVSVTSPLGFPEGSQAGSDLLAELRWYLEEFLEYPFSPNTDRAEGVMDTLKAWGKQAFSDLFNDRDAARMFDEATKEGYANLRLQIMSDNPFILQWPWEALLDPEATFLSLACQMERRLNKVRDPVPISEDLPRDRINILMITARPYERDVRYRSMSRPLVELIDKNNIPAYVHILRPPTFESLREHLRENPSFYHIIHFDGHGGYHSGGGSEGDQHRYLAAEGVLVFEDDGGQPDEIKAEQLSGLLRDNAVPIMVLNACQSAMLDPMAGDPFASVAASLLKAGIRGVVAMAYSLYVSGAEEFLPAFYGELFRTGDLSAATRAGRQKMFSQMKRVCARGRYELRDFIVPVIYQQEPYKLSFSDESKGKVSTKAKLPDEAKDEKNPYGFIGRDHELLKLERAIRKDTPAVLIHGLGGIGKTTLARGFLKWLIDTGGLEGCIWITFADVRSAEYVINYTGSHFFGDDFLTADMNEKIEALAEVLNRKRIIIVWDNFEVVAGIEGTYIKPTLSEKDRAILLSLVKKIRGGKGKILITSRSEEEWLGIQRLKVSISGLGGEEMWEYCEAILDNLGIEIDREDPDQLELMTLLGGHPLAMRVVLPKLENMTARQVIDAIRSNMESLGPEAESLYATLRVVENDLAEELKPLLIPLALHEQFIDAHLLTEMTKKVDETWTEQKINKFLQALSRAGLLMNVGSNVYQLHPALTGFLRSTTLKAVTQHTYDVWCRPFVDVMGSLADELAPRPLHEQRFWFHCHTANFGFAMAEAERLGMSLLTKALTQAMASYAQNTRNFDEACGFYERLARMAIEDDDKELEACTYHQLGMIAQERRDLNTAEEWFDKSLTITERLGEEHRAAATYHQLGRIAQERRDLKTAEEWLDKSLTITEKLGEEHRAAATYHQLGRIAQERRDFDMAEKWYHKALAIEEKQGDEHKAAATYHQLGRIAEERKHFDTADKWYHKSLTITEKLGDQHSAAITYHQLGIIAQERKVLKTAEEWYHKSLAITEKLGDEHSAAGTYHQLGRIAAERRDFETAEKWYLRSLAIKEKLGDEYGAASTCGQLGLLCAAQDRFEESGRWLIKSIITFINCDAPHFSKQGMRNFFIIFRKTPPEAQAKLKAMWQEAGLGAFPKDIDSAKKD